jgi:biopolymer transport protein ExbD
MTEAKTSAGVRVVANPNKKLVGVFCVPEDARAKVLRALSGVLDARVLPASATSFALVVRGDGAVTHQVAVSARNALREAGVALASE